MEIHKRKLQFFLPLIWLFCLLICLPSAAFSAEVALSWNQPDDSRVTGYKIYYGESGTNFLTAPDQTIDSADTTSCIISDLTEGRTYEFAATSFDGNGNESDFSETINYTVADSSPDPNDIDDDGDGYTENQGDCNDNDPSIHPGANEICGDGIDQNCDGSDEICPEDIDQDGDGFSVNQGDCNDNDATVYPGAPEVCGDGIDQNCDGIDETCPEDMDNDGDGYSSNEGDCNDNDPSIHPGAEEICGDGIDQNCDGSDKLCTEIEGVTLSWTRPDDDRVTGYNIYCGPAGTNFKAEVDVSINSPETTSYTFYNLEYGMEYSFAATSFDAEGNESDFSETINYIVTDSSTDPNDIDDDGDGYTENQGDCNDNDPSTHPGAEEICGDGIDQNCDGSDEICPEDIDQDGDGFSANEGDCNDNDATVFPGAIEICGDGIDQNCDGSDLECLPEEETPEFSMETAEIEINSDWKSVSFNKTFENPVVVAKPMSFNNSQPAIVRINNVTTEGFEIKIQKWEYLDGENAAEKVSYLAMEAGHHELPGGLLVEAGTFETSNTETVGFKKPFNQTPVVLSGVTTENDLYAVTGRLYNISKEGFTCTLQEQELHEAGHNSMETISYIAWEPSAGTVSGMNFTVDSTFNEVDHNFCQIQLYPAFKNAPAFLADMQTRNGEDTANIRWKNKTSQTIEIQIDEEQSKDSETDHVTEVVGYMAFDPASVPQSMIFGDIPDADRPGTIQDTFINLNDEVNISGQQLNTYTWPQDMPANAILVKIDLSGLPVGAQIQSATLSLYQTGAGGDGSYDVSAHKIINHDPDLSLANGYTYDSANAWTSNNICYNSIPLAQADIAQAEAVNTLDQSPGYKQWDVTGMALDWAQNPDSNYGMLLNSDTVAASDSYRFFAASETEDAAQRPKFTITYTISTDDIDQDDDGYTVNDGDCNDNDPSIYPGAEEICGDGIDQDCNGSDMACPKTWYRDKDGDGYSDGASTESVERPLSYYYLESELTAITGDCNDDDSSIHPGAEEICGDGIDQDCDGADLECVKRPWWWWWFR